MTVDRSQQIEAFLATAGWPDASHGTLADDASFRRYERVVDGDRRAVLMDAPPDKEDTRPFVTVAQILRDLGLSAPEILAQDAEQGFLLLEDLGDDTYTRVLARGGDEAMLYSLALETLIHLQQHFPVRDQVPDYTLEKMMSEASLLTDYFWPAMKGHPCPESEKALFQGLWRNALSHAFAVPSSLVLRDYHVDNLIHLPGRPGVAACGLLDFQDAVIGPISYDLVSLFEDARRDVPLDMAKSLMQRYFQAFPTVSKDALALSYAVLGVQRATKIIGIFTRLDRRDGKSGYLRHIPRTWRWLEGGLSHPMLRDLKAWYDVNFPPDMRIAPESQPRVMQ
ncbi:MAG: phosphotransferase [Alphaproteobacteria bacterium]|nr:phosphotransferase [Alphaproteobacteria bacterium]